jgi:hypothetical protein
MSYKLKVKEVKEGFSQTDNTQFIDVLVDVLKDGEIAGEKRFGYPLGTSPEAIEADLKKVADTIASDEELAIKNAKFEEELKSIEDAKSLIDKEI